MVIPCGSSVEAVMLRAGIFAGWSSAAGAGVFNFKCSCDKVNWIERESLLPSLSSNMTERIGANKPVPFASME